MELPNTVRVDLPRGGMALTARVYDFVSDCVTTLVDKPATAGEFKQVAEMFKRCLAAKPLLAWARQSVDGRPLDCWEAVLGTAADGAQFRLEYYGTCYRRGRWRMTVEVFGGEHHHSWGCFDDADQPLRYYHDPGNALNEAEAIAAVLLADRLERGPIEGWVGVCEKN